MTELGKVVLASAITFIITFILNAGFSYFSAPVGEVGSGQTLEVDGKIYSILEIENYSNTTLDGLRVNVPADARYDGIVVSLPIEIVVNEKVLNNKGVKQLILNQIPPKRIAKILIPVSKTGYVIDSINHNELSLDYKNLDQVVDPTAEALKYALMLSIIYTVLFFSFDLIQSNRTKKLTQDLEEIKDDSKAEGEHLRKITEALKEDLYEAKYSSSRARILLQARLSDYAKELGFWRDTIRKVMYNSTGKTISSDSLIEAVTENLKTYGAKSGKEIDFSTIEALAMMMNGKNNS